MVIINYYHSLNIVVCKFMPSKISPFMGLNLIYESLFSVRPDVDEVTMKHVLPECVWISEPNVQRHTRR